MREVLALGRVREMIADNAYALTFQTFAQYRQGLLKEVGALIQAAIQHDDERVKERLHAGCDTAQVLFLGGPADGRRQVVSPVPGTYRVPMRPRPVFMPSLDMAAAYVEDEVKIVEYRLDRIIDGETNKTHFLYVLPGLNTAAQLVAGYRAARS